MSATRAEHGLPVPEPHKPGHGWGRRAAYAMATLIGMGTAAAGISRVANVGPLSNGSSSPDQGTHLIVDGQPSQTPLASASPEPPPSPTFAPTPSEAPRFVYHSLDQITAELHEAQAQGKNIFFVDTWSNQGGTYKIDKSPKGPRVLILDNFHEGDILYSPFEGIVTSIGTGVGQGARVALIFFTINGKELEMIVNTNDTILVKPGEQISIGTRILTFSGQPIPKTIGATGFAILEMEDISDSSILQNESGTPIALNPQ